MTKSLTRPKKASISVLGLLLALSASPQFTPVFAQVGATTKPASGSSGEVYGPPNLLKTMKTPFSGSTVKQSEKKKKARELKRKEQESSNSLGTISLAPRAGTSRLSALTLKRKLVPSRIYLPERMIIGKPATFVIKGKGGSSVAVAMADRDSGSKPVMGHKLRLGSDRKVVAVGKIPESGVLEIVIGTPIEGDLIGQQLFFEAAIWTEDDMKDLEFAETIPPNSESGAKNGVVIAGDMPKKRGVRIVPDSVLPFSQRSTQSSSLSSGQP